MKLEDIGFYTLSDERAQTISIDSPLARCELIVTSRCNFRCPYCRGIRKDIDKELTLEEAKTVIDLWAANSVKNIRISGGEPTVWKPLSDLVAYAKDKGIARIAISSNGSADSIVYKKLVACGVNDFSISLDACCASTGDIMAGQGGYWKKVVDNITLLAKMSYTTVGVVLTENNIGDLHKIITFAHGLGVHDIRIIPAAQFDNALANVEVEKAILQSHPILKYRIDNIHAKKSVRGIGEQDAHCCSIVLDDMAIAGDYHFPCIIFLRERGEPIGTWRGKTIQEIRQARRDWMLKTDTFNHPICKQNCLDCIVLFNNTASEGKING